MRSRLTGLLGIELPLVQAPMAGANDSALAIAVSEAGGLGSLPAAMLTPEGLAAELEAVRAATRRPINVNFFCHRPPDADPAGERRWKDRLLPYYRELGLDPEAPANAPNRAPFDEAMCEVVEEARPEVVSFHFGLPAPPLLDRVRSSGAKILASATTVAEARWLEDHGCDVIVAQGAEAGGHRGMFLATDVANQVGTMALVPQVVDAVRLPVLASGGISDARGIVAALALGADGVQLGTAFMLCPEATTSAVHRAALADAGDDATALTNVMTGRPARGVVNRLMAELGPLSGAPPAFPLGARPLAPLRARAEADGAGDFSPLWAGQAAPLARALPAGALTRQLMEEADGQLRQLAARATEAEEVEEVEEVDAGS